jgi:hypothetical protein
MDNWIRTSTYFFYCAPNVAWPCEPARTIHYSLRVGTFALYCGGPIFGL